MGSGRVQVYLGDGIKSINYATVDTYGERNPSEGYNSATNNLSLNLLDHLYIDSCNIEGTHSLPWNAEYSGNYLEKSVLPDSGQSTSVKINIYPKDNLTATVKLSATKKTLTYYATIEYSPGAAGDSATNMPSDIKNDTSSTKEWKITLSSKTPKWTGHTFVGWYCSVNNEIYGEGAEYTVEGSTTKSASKYTLVAQWTKDAVYHSVIFFHYGIHSDGSTELFDTTYGTVLDGSTINVPSYKVNENNYPKVLPTFNTSVYTTSGKPAAYEVISAPTNFTLYYYIGYRYATLSFDLNGGGYSDESIFDDKEYEGTDTEVTFYFPNVSPKKDGYKFQYWLYGEKHYNKGASIKLNTNTRENNAEYTVIAYYTKAYCVTIGHYVRFEDKTISKYDETCVDELDDGDTVDLTEQVLDDDDIEMFSISDDDTGDDIDSVTIDEDDVYVSIFYDVVKRSVTFYIYKDNVSSDSKTLDIEVLDKDFNTVELDLPYISAPINYTYSHATKSDGTKITSISMKKNGNHVALLYFVITQYTVSFYHYIDGDNDLFDRTSTKVRADDNYLNLSEHTVQPDGSEGYGIKNIFDKDGNMVKNYTVQITSDTYFDFYYVIGVFDITINHYRGNNLYSTSTDSQTYGTEIDPSKYIITTIPCCVYASLDPVSKIIIKEPLTISIKYKYRWDNPPKTGDPWRITAKEWNYLRDFIDDQLLADKKSKSGLEDVNRDEIFTFTHYNNMRDAIGKGSSVVRWQEITQALMDELVANANAMADL